MSERSSTAAEAIAGAPPSAPESGSGGAETRAPQRRNTRERTEQRVLELIETARAKPPRFRDDQVTMAHGAGGKASRSLVEGLILPAFASEALAPLDDAGHVTIDDTGLAMSTDSFVVKPISFPAGRSASSPSTARSTTSPSPARAPMRSPSR